MSLKISSARPAKASNVKVIVLDMSTLPRINASMTIADLKFECKARGLKGYSTILKDGLTNLLGLNSIALSCTNEYKVVEEIKMLMETERKERLTKQAEEKQKQQQQPIRMISGGMVTTDFGSFSNNGSNNAATPVPTIHTQFHRCKLVSSKDLWVGGSLRSNATACDMCRRSNPAYCCVPCNWDICNSCFLGAAPTATLAAKRSVSDTSFSAPESKTARYGTYGYEDEDIADEESDAGETAFYEEHGHAPQENDRRRNFGHDSPTPHSEEDDSDEESVESVYKENIKTLTKKNKDRKKLLKYVVWFSDGYPNDGWHSYNGDPEKEFDSSFNTIEEANSRVRYKFIYDNVWGLSRREMLEKEVEEHTDKKTKLLTMRVHPDDSSIFTVSAVTKTVFEYLASEAAAGSEDDEDDRGYTAGDFGYSSAW